MNAHRSWGTRFLFFVVAGVTVLPMAVFLVSSLMEQGGVQSRAVLGPSFLRALGRSAGQAAILSVLGFAVGWPLGTLCGLQQPRGTKALMWLLLLPVAAPPYLWALAIQALRPLLPYAHQPWLDGFPGVLLALTPLSLPLPLLAAWISARRLPASQIESMWMAAGPSPLLNATLRHTCASACAGAILAGALVFADAGCDQIMGCHGFSSEVLIAFASRYDFALAAVKAGAGALIVAPFALVAALLFARQWPCSPPARAGLRAATGLKLLNPAWLIGLLGLLICFLLFVPLAGLCLPLLHQASSVAFESAIKLWMDRAWFSLQRPLAAVLFALPMGLGLAAVARFSGKEGWLALLAMASLALPGIFAALGWSRLVSWFPGVFLPVQESGWLVGLCSGFRTAPLAALFLSMGLRRLAGSAWDAADVAGVSRWRWWMRVVLPQLGASALISGAVVGLLAMADIDAELILQAPGKGSFSAHLFAVMDNASANKVAVLAITHLGSVWLIFSGVAIGARVYGTSTGPIQ